MRIGPLNKRITVETYTKTRDVYGSEVKIWAIFTTVWASVEPLIGKEYIASKQMQAEVSHKIRVRYLAGLLPTMRIQWDGRTFTIDSILNVQERNKEIVIMASENV